MPFIDSHDGTRLFYSDSGQGRPLVLLSSATMGHQLWDLHVPTLTEQGRRCVTYDRRGHGRSDWPWHGYDYDGLADDLHHLVEELDLDGVTLVGNAMGCGEVVRYLSRHGSARVERIVLVATTTPMLAVSPTNPDGLDPGVLEAMLTGLRTDRPGYTAQITLPFFAGPGASPGDLPISQELAGWMGQQSLNSSLRAATEVYRTLFTTDLRPDLGKIDVPALLVHGRRDPVAPIALCAEQSADEIRDSRLVVYDDASHGLVVTHAARLVQELLAVTS
ncbi:alpha/beta hydrolase [Micromonospora sp. NPDC000207]|uniref:alpha/beta fold hydrolase n=1 Tax=Micromonospora sp. NPDC000207 TaxID=3154246 RepID=UPI003321DC1D